MKTLTGDALAEIAQQYGTEPITLLQIFWSSTSSTLYSDKKIDGAEGKILSIGAIQSVLTPENVQSLEVNVTLDDTDGSIKAITDQQDIHKKKAIIYQYYGDLTLNDKFTIFQGQISTPFEWGEQGRQISFSVLSQIESFEVGFSPEEGQLDFVSPEFVGQPWPLAFGRVVHVPAQKVKQVDEAILLESVGLIDPTLVYKLDQIEAAQWSEQTIFNFWQLVMTGADAMAPPISWITQEYVKALLIYTNTMPWFLETQRSLDNWRRFCENFPADAVARLQLTAAEEDFTSACEQMYVLQQRKEYLEGLTRVALFAFGLKKHAMQEQIKSHSNLRRIYGIYVETWREYCNQERLQKSCVKVQDSTDIFPQDTPVDITIKGLNWRVTFSDDVMCALTPPLAQYENLLTDAWVPDDEPCANLVDVDGLDVFYLLDVPAPNLEGLYLLVKKKGTDDTDGEIDRHVIRVSKQIGNKVYFDLVRWNDSGPGGPPRGLDLQSIIQQVVQTPYITLPWGSVVPADVFTGDLDPAIWNRPESKLLLQILTAIGPVSQEELAAIVSLVFMLPSDKMGPLWIATPGPRDTFTIIGKDVDVVVEAAGTILPHWLQDYRIPAEEIPEKVEWLAAAGSKIRSAGRPCEIYVANLLPSTVKAVHAYRTNEDGERFLAPVPSRYYVKNESANLGTYTVTALTFLRPLTEMGEGWEDDVYVTMDSSVGPNVVDIIEWLIDTYLPEKTPNASNFAAIKTKQTNYPADFYLDNRPDALAEIQRIAWESRMAVLFVGDEVFLKYLSEEPSSDATIDESDVELTDGKSIVVEYTETENLVTELICTFKSTYLPLEGRNKDPRVILRHNVQKYGLHRQEEFFHIYTNKELVEKSATFWMIRMSNTWKKLRFSTFHTNIRLDTLDTVLLDFNTAYFSSSAIKGIVEEATYDPEDNSIELLVHTGVRTGEMVQYVHFWPAGLDPSIEYPLDGDYAGGYGPGAGVTGTIGDCPL